MEITLRREEADLLHRILEEHLSDLRMEIAGTDSYTMREALKGDEETIKGLLARLEQHSSVPGS